MNMNENRRRQRGQALVEYALIIWFVFFATFLSVVELLDHVGEFYSNIMRVVCTPLP